MQENRLGVAESRFADIIWKNEPMSTTALVRECEKEFTWKRTTTYTVLKRLCEREIFELKDGVVKALVSREEFYARQSEEYIEESFDGSLPAFLAAFTSRNKISKKDLAEIRQLLEKFES